MHKNMSAVRCALLGMAVLLTSGTAALADPTMLVCDLQIDPAFGTQTGPTVITLNEGQGSVVVNFSAWRLGGNGPRSSVIPGSSAGPLPAKFGADTIT